MFVIGFILFLFVFLLLYIPHSFLYWPVFALLVYYVFLILDDAHEKGTKSWNRFRSLFIWRKTSAVTYAFGDEKFLMNGLRQKPKLFVVYNNMTNVGLIDGFGLHGGVFKDIDLCFMLPSFLFNVPFLREILMYIGAVSDNTHNITKLLKKGKSVVYSMGGMKHEKHKKDGELIFPEDFYDFLKDSEIDVIPVYISRETDRYKFYRNDFQKMFYKYIGYPLTFFFHVKLNERQPPKILLNIGEHMTFARYKSYQDFSHSFFMQILDIESQLL